ncbi:MAG TPA: DUF885 domain-containing protein [Burkholderiaceae bacterium]|nr:DUF885 domain-containing protein [Burkholderiaceae bacterium]
MTSAPWLNLASQPQPRDADARFLQLVEIEWAWRLAQFPQFATSVGEHRHDDRLERVDAQTRRERLENWRRTRTQLAKIPVGEMSPERRIDRAVYEHQLDAFIADLEVGADLLPINSDSNFYGPLLDLPDNQPLANGADYHRYLARLADIPRFFDEHIELMREGLARGVTVPQVALAGRELPLEAMAAVEDATLTPFYKPFRKFPANAPAAERAALCAHARHVIASAVLPAYRKLLAFMRETYVPGARQTISARDLPQGEAFYRAQVRKFTTLPLEPAEIHARGVAEVARIRAEMQGIQREVGFTGDFGAFLAFLRQDAQFYARSAQELLSHAAWICKRVDGLLPRYFGTLPRQTYGVAPVPEDIAPFYTAGRYVPAAQVSGASGTFWLNTYALASRPLYTLPALVLHEAVPGHHLQIALASEGDAQLPFRRYGYVDACGEGWALYAEHLGDEMGIYQTPYEQFGRLTYEMWRACRLVVDTGLHAMQWSREDARSYMLAHTALSEHEVATEVDRYISWPGQALSYKLGEMKIRELREAAQARLGHRFDVRAFHDAVLAQGSVPLGVLESQIDDWIARR